MASHAQHGVLATEPNALHVDGMCEVPDFLRNGGRVGIVRTKRRGSENEKEVLIAGWYARTALFRHC